MLAGLRTTLPCATVDRARLDNGACADQGEHVLELEPNGRKYRELPAERFIQTKEARWLT